MTNTQLLVACLLSEHDIKLSEKRACRSTAEEVPQGPARPSTPAGVGHLLPTPAGGWLLQLQIPPALPSQRAEPHLPHAI
jgi:hypothetical protein